MKKFRRGIKIKAEKMKKEVSSYRGYIVFNSYGIFFI